ncbi:MAG: UbiX family flavin prenyltransferase [Clostridia bacterium]|nr:UbiX family flavin prenyltransferase [Clostridia bacterium]
MERRLVVGISGASGAPVAVEVLRGLSRTDVEVHLVVTQGGEMTLRQECGMMLSELQPLCAQMHDVRDIGASVASGSFKTMGMLIVPASMKTVAGVASGYSDNLLLRAADVTLKEHRRLVLAARECPLSSIHLRNMLELSRMGAVIAPLMLEYYSQPKTVEEITHHNACKLLDLFDIEAEEYRRWKGMSR